MIRWRNFILKSFENTKNPTNCVIPDAAHKFYRANFSFKMSHVFTVSCRCSFMNCHKDDRACFGPILKAHSTEHKCADICQPTGPNYEAIVHRTNRIVLTCGCHSAAITNRIQLNISTGHRDNYWFVHTESRYSFLLYNVHSVSRIHTASYWITTFEVN